MSRTERTELLIGAEGIERRRPQACLFSASAVWAAMYVRPLPGRGVGTIHIVDNDIVSESNINRQIIASYDTVGMEKTRVMEQRILSVNPDCRVKRYDCFYLPGDGGAPRSLILPPMTMWWTL